MLMSRHALLRGLAACMLAAGIGPAAAQDYPSQPVKLVVPFPPGGSVDTLARSIAERLAQAWGKPVVVETKPGASTIIGTEQVVNAPPDGHTLLVTTDSSITSNPHLFKKLPFDPIRQLAPVTQLVDVFQLVLAHPSVKAANGRELIALAKKDPKALNYASYGAGSQPHLFFEALRAETGAAVEHIPFKGAAPAMQAVIAGETHLTLIGPAIAAAHVKSGTVRALAISYQRRVAAHPEIPTLKEAGFPAIDLRAWFGVLAPAGTPASVIERISSAMRAVIEEAAFKARHIEARGFVGVGSAPAAFAKYIAEDLAYKGRLIKGAGIKPE